VAADERDQTLLRQQALELKLPGSVAVVGCGGVGSWVALFLALSGVEEIWLFDGDTVSEHNLNRVLLTKADVGASKSEKLEELIHKYRPGCVTYACGKWTPEVADGVGLHVDYVVAATDTTASREQVAEWAGREEVRYIEVAAEGEVGSITGEIAEFVTPEDGQVGYQSVPVWLGPAVGAALMAVSYVVHGAGPGDRVLRAGWDGDGYGLYDSSKQPESMYYEPGEENITNEEVG